MAKKEFRLSMLSVRQLRFRAAGRILRGHDDDLAEAELILEHLRDRKEMTVPSSRPTNLHLVRTDREQ
jgi:hypothetical protein